MKRAAVPSILVAVVLLALGVTAEAQQPTKVGKIGWLSIGLDYGPGSTIRAVPPELRALAIERAQLFVCTFQLIQTARGLGTLERCVAGGTLDHAVDEQPGEQ